MVVRSFARRHLVAVRCCHARSLSYSTPIASEGSIARSDEPNRMSIRQSGVFRPDFFSSRISMPQTALKKSEGSSTKSEGREVWHPLVRQLRRELKGKDITRNIDRIWTIYLAIHDFQHTAQSFGSSSSHPSIPVLHAEDHQAVLRAITGGSRRQTQHDLEKKAFVTNRYQGRFAASSSGVSDNVKEYLTRVSFIFTQLRQYNADNLPNVADYDVVLGRLAPHGNMPALTALWAHLTGSTSEDFSVRQLKSISLKGTASSSLVPMAGTYLHLMLGISRHLATQIQRIHKQNLTDGIWKGQGRKRMRKEESSARAAARGNALYGQQVSPQARKAVQLAAARTVSLLDDMLQRHITPDKMTIDLALRIFRMDGNLEGVTSILKLFAVDLKNPDADIAAIEGDRREPLSMDVHTLNTVVMALGEQATASEMIAAYETLSKPLPARRSADSSPVGGSLFALDWQGIFSAKAEDVVIQAQSEPSEISTKEAALFKDTFSITPNTTTMTTMIKHCCTAPDPTRMVAGLNVGGSRQSQKKQEDHEARKKGEYVSVASYLLSEAMSLQEEQLARLAQQIGFDLPDIEAMVQKVINWTAECELEATEDTPRNSKEDFISKLVEERKESASLLCFETDFVPHFEATNISVNYEMIQPIVGHASRRRTSNFSQWRSIISHLQRAMAIKVVELRVLHSAVEMWDTLRREGGYNTAKATNEGLRAFVNALRKQRKLVRDDLDSMASHFVDEVLRRFATLRQHRRERQYQPILKRRLSQQRDMEKAVLLEEKKARAEKVKLLEAEEAATSQERSALELAEEGRGIVPAVEPAFK